MSIRKTIERPFIVAIAVAAAFFIGTSLFAVGPVMKFDSPDETANFTLIRSFVERGTFRIPEPLTEITTIVGPRSFSVRSGELLPGSFLGLPLAYGLVGKLIGVRGTLFLTPLLSAAAIVAFYLLLRRFLTSRTSLIGSFLLAVHPAFWYWSARGMFHNALVLDAVVIGLALLVYSDRSGVVWRRMIVVGVAGAALGLAVAARTSEAPWIAALAVTVTIVTTAGWPARLGRFMALAAGALVAIVPMLALNQSLFGQPLSFAYTPEPIVADSAASVAAGLAAKVGQLLFPFGVDLRTMATNVWHYGLSVFWLPSLLTIGGFILAVRSPDRRRYAAPIAAFVITSLWLTLFYGSWVFNDNPDPTAVTIGTSFTRYWLPMYVAGLPFAALFIERLLASVASKPSPSRWTVLGPAAAILALVLFLVQTAIADPGEGLAAVRRHTVEYRRLADLVVRSTPSDAVIVAGRADKVFFPERDVVYTVTRPPHFAGVRKLLDVVPVYVYVSPVEAPEAVQGTWRTAGFKLMTPVELTDRERLYRVVWTGDRQT